MLNQSINQSVGCTVVRCGTVMVLFLVTVDDDVCLAQLLRKYLPTNIGEYKNHPL